MKTRLSFVVTGATSSGELSVHPTLWKTWHAWMWEQIVRYGYVTQYDAVHEGARVAKATCGYGTSVTTWRYLQDAIGDGKHGDFARVYHKDLGWVIKFSEKKLKELELLQ